MEKREREKNENRWWWPEWTRTVVDRVGLDGAARRSCDEVFVVERGAWAEGKNKGGEKGKGKKKGKEGERRGGGRRKEKKEKGQGKKKKGRGVWWPAVGVSGWSEIEWEGATVAAGWEGVRRKKTKTN
ncbi:hypothetical protein ES288_A10G189400v1 [Gossypium darwinii]|uniref:Uncharacterized protein n=1 Tax=Gossypium darwinii TaxID=34276 RepID=A0A5D2F3V5_GOSDA|nr:hypothetical protein ES288_A10G189400v1 [Gossypium darwinii]